MSDHQPLDELELWEKIRSIEFSEERVEEIVSTPDGTYYHVLEKSLLAFVTIARHNEWVISIAQISTEIPDALSVLSNMDTRERFKSCDEEDSVQAIIPTIILVGLNCMRVVTDMMIEYLDVPERAIKGADEFLEIYEGIYRIHPCYASDVRSVFFSFEINPEMIEEYEEDSMSILDLEY